MDREDGLLEDEMLLARRDLANDVGGRGRRLAGEGVFIIVSDGSGRRKGS